MGKIIVKGELYLLNLLQMRAGEMTMLDGDRKILGVVVMETVADLQICLAAFSTMTKSLLSKLSLLVIIDKAVCSWMSMSQSCLDDAQTVWQRAVCINGRLMEALLHGEMLNSNATIIKRWHWIWLTLRRMGWPILKLKYSTQVCIESLTTESKDAWVRTA